MTEKEQKVFDFLERSYKSLIKESLKDSDQLSSEQEFKKLYPKEFIINRVNEFNSIIRGITREDISKESYQKLSRYFLKLHALILIAKKLYIKPEEFPNIETL